tara:strand:+ start:377 stop:571 length:195 start_codon:yes stop_codon:yes gene_type:complete
MEFEFHYDDAKSHEQNFRDWFRLNTAERSYERRLGFKVEDYTLKEAREIYEKMWGKKLEANKQA